MKYWIQSELQSKVTHSASHQKFSNSNERIIYLRDETNGPTLQFIELFGFSYKMANLKDNYI